MKRNLEAQSGAEEITGRGSRPNLAGSRFRETGRNRRGQRIAEIRTEYGRSGFDDQQTGTDMLFVRLGQKSIYGQMGTNGSKWTNYENSVMDNNGPTLLVRE